MLLVLSALLGGCYAGLSLQFLLTPSEKVHEASILYGCSSQSHCHFRWVTNRKKKDIPLGTFVASPTR